MDISLEGCIQLISEQLISDRRRYAERMLIFYFLFFLCWKKFTIMINMLIDVQYAMLNPSVYVYEFFKSR